MQCPIPDQQLYALVDDILDEPVRTEAELHLRACVNCLARKEQLAEVVRALESVLNDVHSSGVHDRMFQRISASISQEGVGADAGAAGDPAGSVPDEEKTRPLNPPAAAADMNGLVGRELAQFKLLRMLGKGGWGTVFLAHDTSLDRAVALKILRPDFTHDPQVMHRFKREAKAAARIDHPNVVMLFSLREMECYHVLEMEYVEGTDARRCVHDQGPMPEQRALQLAEQVAGALGAAHAHGIVHRDVKPHNILLTHSGDVKLTDFGLAKLAEESFTRTGIIMGTVSYMSPEQLRDSKRVGPAADVYGLGCTLFYILTGKTVFTGKENEQMMGHLYRTARDVRELRPELSEGLAELIAKMLVKEPEARVDSMEQVVDAISKLRTRRE